MFCTGEKYTGEWNENIFKNSCFQLILKKKKKKKRNIKYETTPRQKVLDKKYKGNGTETFSKIHVFN